MMISRGQGRLLLPARPSFVVLSISMALTLQIALMLVFGSAGVWLPDFLLIVLLFWVLAMPRWVGLGWAFFLGLCLDMLHYGLLGQHALVFVSMAALVLVLQRRLQHFTPLEQIPQLWGVFFIGQLLWIVTGVLSSWTWPGWLALLTPFLEALLWPLMVWLLQIPQRRAHDADLHRPLAM